VGEAITPSIAAAIDSPVILIGDRALLTIQPLTSAFQHLQPLEPCSMGVVKSRWWLLRMRIKLFKNQQPPKKRCGWNRVLVELDGSHIRTGILTPTETEELTPLRHLRRCKRQTDWREVRVSFARPVEQKEKRTFVASTAWQK
jgi:hypothetical protein